MDTAAATRAPWRAGVLGRDYPFVPPEVRPVTRFFCTK
jgi:hypothetical protein